MRHPSYYDKSKSFLHKDGSIVIEMGNSWIPGRPVQSLLHLESLIDFVKHPESDLRLCQQFVCYNPTRLPSPATWVTVKRIRTTDSYTNVWWMAKSDFPKADNKKVLRAYSDGMKSLLKRQSYNTGRRPSQHIISETGFLSDNGGSIAHNVLEFEQMDPERQVRLPEVLNPLIGNSLSISNNNSNDYFMRVVRERGLELHPARMPYALPAFFIEFLTQPGDLVLDPFAGSNTTGFVAEFLNRNWLSIEILEDYVELSKIRFDDPILVEKENEKQLFTQQELILK
jgi:site-specific DNA-methyltransferase (cytosine-N4-specific)